MKINFHNDGGDGRIVEQDMDSSVREFYFMESGSDCTLFPSLGFCPIRFS